MLKLLRATFRRYFKSLVFWLTVLASLANGVFSGLMLKNEGSLEDVFFATEFLLFAVLISLSVGREYHEGGFRNKLIAGYTKGGIFASEYIAAFTLSFLQFALWYLLVGIINSEAVFKIPDALLLPVACGILFVAVAAISITFSVCVLVSRRAVNSVVGILLVLCIFGAAYTVKAELNERETVVEYLYAEDGTPIGPGESVPNPEYVGGFKRDVYVFINNINPFGNLLEYKSEIYPFFRRTFYMVDRDLSHFELAEDIRDKFMSLPIYQLGIAALFVCVGFFAFRKKELR